MKQTVKQTADSTPANRGEPLILRKRIGSAVYTVSVRFSETSKEALNDKILRLIEREVQGKC
jgi:hypothetical protein